MTKRRLRSDKNKLLSEEDIALWRHTTERLDPLRTGKKSRVIFGTSVELRSSTASAQAENSPADVKLDRTQIKKAPHPNKLHRPSPTPPSKTPHLAQFDQRAARRIRSGRTEIEARIDLHGMRQHEAHSALRAFLLGSHARGLRWVLVITGKGGSSERDDRDITHWNTPERGVLKRNVPRWLSEPDMRSLVVSYTTASLSHGGEGALYVQLRAKRR
ncbi:Smr/MutS family protein [Filomicrobium sp.]|uniref:Smr/MutS family protein n=1 Tax=Filomicrobium sp. TaxID=2024831 RepID=UPI0025828D33|nr:Smr/MutS family protein [Filomicrobium sp.]MCV0368479.1 Smr/MutS family protein [Filomicrobium sp.]